MYFSLSWFYLRTPLISLNSLLRRVPRLVKTVTSATAINEAISAYSIAVAPDSLLTNALRDLIIFLLLLQKWSSIRPCIVRRPEWGQITGPPVSPKLIRSGEARRFEEAFPLG